MGIIRHLADKRQNNLKMEDGHESSPDLGAPLRRQALAKTFHQRKHTNLHFQCNEHLAPDMDGSLPLKAFILALRRLV